MGMGKSRRRIDRPVRVRERATTWRQLRSACFKIYTTSLV